MKAVGAEQKSRQIPADNPITDPQDDRLARATPARSFAEQVLALDASEGAVVGVLGPWGSGKTSFVNLARRHLGESAIPVLDFNPWMFSGAEQLVQSFFVEISAQLTLRGDLGAIGDLLADYGETFAGLAWLPLVGPWIERGRMATKLVGKLLQRRKEGIGARRSRIYAALAKLEKPIVVVLDDIDRLTTSEIRDVFKLVRLTAQFPKVIYVLAFDRLRVEQALAEQGIPGRDYLEKILQLGIDLPAIPAEVLSAQVLQAIDTAISGVETPGHFDPITWPDVFMEVVRPLIRNMRDVRRYAAAVHGTVRDLGGQVALVDMLALEAIRVFLPDVFRTLPGSIDGLTSTSDGHARDAESARLKEQVESLIGIAGERDELVRDMVQRLFPGGQRHVGGSHYGGEWKHRWLRERRVAHEDVLRFYLERVLGERLQAFSDAERAWSRMNDRDALDSFLRSLPIERVQDVIGSLEAYEDQFVPEHLVPVSIVLLNLLPTLPQRPGGMFDFDARLVVGRVVFRLLRAFKDPQALEAAVREILPQLSSLSSKLEVIGDVGYRDGVGHKLITEPAAEALEKEWRGEVRATSPDGLAQETELLRTLALTKRDAEPGEPALEIPDAATVTLALLKSARSESRSQAFGSRTVRRKPRLAWDTLVELYGDEDMLRRRIDALMISSPADVGDLLQLAEKYLSGWRPKAFGDD